MVFSVDITTEPDSTATTDTKSGDLDVVETLERFSAMLEPFVQLLTVVVQALTAYTLMRKV